MKLIHGDCLDVMARGTADTFDAIVTDPPYGLNFMGKEWDHGVPGVPFWEQALRVTKPGGMLLAFGGTRTHHRLMCAIEDAGWEIRDCLMWLYGTGFPKSHNIGKALDKIAGVEREIVGKNPNHRPDAAQNQKDADKEWFQDRSSGLLTSPATDNAKLWEGWGTALKPAWEPIILAMKPCEGTFASNALTHGVAGLNIDGCKIGTDTITSSGSAAADLNKRRFVQGTRPKDYTEEKTAAPTTHTGRWPANVVLAHSPECERTGTKQVKSGVAVNRNRKDEKSKQVYGDFNKMQGEDVSYAGEDGLEEMEAWTCAPNCPIKLLDEQGGKRGGSPGSRSNKARKGNSKGTDKDHQTQGYTDTGGASRFFYCAKASKKERGEGNKHPTVKPLALMRWLCRLVKTPTRGKILDPFMGSGTTGIAALEEGMEFVGIEKEEEHFDTATRRINGHREC